MDKDRVFDTALLDRERSPRVSTRGEQTFETAQKLSLLMRTCDKSTVVDKTVGNRTTGGGSSTSSRGTSAKAYLDTLSDHKLPKEVTHV